MPRLVFFVDVETADVEDDTKYLLKLRDTFVNIVELASWGFTNDEIFTRSTIEDSSVE